MTRHPRRLIIQPIPLGIVPVLKQHPRRPTPSHRRQPLHMPQRILLLVIHHLRRLVIPHIPRILRPIRRLPSHPPRPPHRPRVHLLSERESESESESEQVTERVTERATERATERVTERATTFRPIDRSTDRPIDRSTDRPIDRSTDRPSFNRHIPTNNNDFSTHLCSQRPRRILPLRSPLRLLLRDQRIHRVLANEQNAR